MAPHNDSHPPGEIHRVYCAAKNIVERMKDPSDAKKKQGAWNRKKEAKCYEILKQDGSISADVKESANEMVEKRGDPYDTDGVCPTPSQ